MPAIFIAYPNAFVVTSLLKKPCCCFDFLQHEVVWLLLSAG